MIPKSILYSAVTVAIFAAGYLIGTVHAAGPNRVFELRTYTTAEGKLDALQARFRDHTTRLFEKHGMTNIGYFVPEDGPQAKNTLVYLLAFPSRDAAKKSWDGFRNDPDWKKVQSESEAGGKIVLKVESMFLDPTDFSKIK